MINLSYKRLFNLQVVHDYHENLHEEELELIPAHSTYQFLKNRRMLLRKIESGITVLYETVEDESSPLIPIDKDVKLIFGLKAKNPKHFFNVTEIDSPDTLSQFLYFKNSTAGIEEQQNLHHENIGGLKNRHYSYQFRLPDYTGEVAVYILNSVGEKILFTSKPQSDKATLMPNSDGAYKQHINLKHLPEGLFQIVVENAETDEELARESFFAADDFAEPGIIGIVEIFFDKNQPDFMGEFALRFERKSVFWRYYIVNKNNKVSGMQNLVVEDDSENFSDFYSKVAFNVEGDIPHAEVRINDKDTVVFISGQPIPFYDQPKQSIRLKNSADNSVLINHLPNPSHSTIVKAEGGVSVSEVFVFI